MGKRTEDFNAQWDSVSMFLSKTFCKAECRYCVTRRELLTVISAIQQFRYYLRSLHFKVRTDHSALQWLMSFTEPEGQVAYRWDVDTLSHWPCVADDCHYCEKKEAQEAEQLQTEVKCAAVGPGWLSMN